jgi:hypothetical protein
MTSIIVLRICLFVYTIASFLLRRRPCGSFSGFFNVDRKCSAAFTHPWCFEDGARCREIYFGKFDQSWTEVEINDFSFASDRWTPKRTQYTQSTPS